MTRPVSVCVVVWPEPAPTQFFLATTLTGLPEESTSESAAFVVAVITTLPSAVVMALTTGSDAETSVDVPEEPATTASA